MAPSTPEEIARQHAEAMTMVYQQKMTCAPRQELGEIDLEDKRRPTWIETPPPPPPTRTAMKTSLTADEKKDHDHDEMDQVIDEDDSNSSNNNNIEYKTNMNHLNSLKNPVCFTTRGIVDVSTLQDMVREGHHGKALALKKKEVDDDGEYDDEPSPTNYWDPRNAARHNVGITRPSHDGWGIGKIVLIFSDDFLTKVYHLPWWKDFEPVLRPVLDVLEQTIHSHGRNTGRLVVVRALLASLPPGVTIPVHNDSGEWVKATHRVHVPILVDDPSKILFRCGPAPHMMQRIDCEPGHVFEINNQAKHAVSNCDPNHSRVHLILDYVVTSTVDPLPSALTPIVLEAGEILVQTRRSIDRLKDVRQRPTPSYMILGAQKAGTTSLYDYINQHPWVVQARRRETHCLDWRWKVETTAAKQLAYCQKFFFADQLARHPSCLTGDSTPSYLLDSRRVIPRIRKVFSWKMKFFVMMRDPVRRAASHYAMVTSKEGTPAQLKTRGSEWRNMSMLEVVEMEMEKMEDCGLIPYWQRDDTASPSSSITNGHVDQERFDRFVGSPQEERAWNRYLELHVPLNTGSYGLLTRGMYAIQLRPWFQAFDRDQFLCLQLEAMKTKGVQHIMEQVWAHLDLPRHPVDDESPKNTREYANMNQDLERCLRRFYEPHNHLLASVLQSDAEEWKNPWPYKQC